MVVRWLLSVNSVQSGVRFWSAVVARVSPSVYICGIFSTVFWSPPYSNGSSLTHDLRNHSSEHGAVKRSSNLAPCLPTPGHLTAEKLRALPPLPVTCFYQ